MGVLAGRGFFLRWFNRGRGLSYIIRGEQYSPQVLLAGNALCMHAWLVYILN